MKKLLGLALAVALVATLTARPAIAQSIQTPPVVVDRTAVTLTYEPIGGGSTFDIAVSWRLNTQWDLLINDTSPSAGATAFRVGGRYHLAPPASQFDTYVTLQFFSPSTGSTHFEVGAGLIETLAPGLKSFGEFTYVSATPTGSVNPYIAGNVGLQWAFSRQIALVAGFEVSNNFDASYVGLSYDLTTR